MKPKVEIRQRPVTFQLDVYLFDNFDGKTFIYNLDGSVREELDHGGTSPEPTVTLDEDTLAAIVAAGADILPPDRAQAAHLADAIQVRDRLLTMVETERGGAE